MTYDFDERLNFSQGKRGERDAEILKHAIQGCVSVQKTDIETDKKGVDYIATLEGGAEITVDVKARDKGVSKYWRDGKEDLVLELWSVYPDEDNEGKIGWTLSDKTNVDFILYTFDETDSNKYYLLPFQPLRMAFVKNKREWLKKYKTSFTHSGNWSSQAIFVPVTEIYRAIAETMQGKIENTMKEG